MSDDDKLDFFLRHWKRIVEWSALRQRAADILDQALLEALEDLAQADGTTHLDTQTGSIRYSRLHIPSKSHDVWLEFQWERKRLFQGGWPMLIVVWNKDSSTEQVRAAVKDATATKCADLGMRTAGKPRAYWVWYAELPATDEPFDLQEYARECVERFRQAWVTLGSALERAVTSALGPENTLV